jgi:putative transposase
MTSIALKDVLGKAACRVQDADGMVFSDMESVTAGMLKVMYEALAVSEVEKRAGARLHERGETRSDYRNGYRTRTLQTSYTTIEITIPRLRGQGFVPSFLESGHRAVREVENWVEKAYLSGLSRSEVIRFMESITGCRPSESLLLRVQKELDKRVKAFRERRLDGKYQYLFLDAAWAKDIVGVSATRICIMTAVGVTHSGTKEILGFERTQRENESAWRGFLGRLVSRGLAPSNLEMVISDEHKGILGAATEVFGDVPHQLCWAHRCRNVRKAVDAADRKEIIEGLREVYKAAHLGAAKDALKKWQVRWSEKYPAVVSSVMEDTGRLLVFFGCPELHREYVRTSNPIERVFRELRRQQYGLGAYANRDACNRAVFRVYFWLNDRWQDKDIWQDRIRRRKREAAKQAH